jgi:hypothetical protein
MEKRQQPHRKLLSSPDRRLYTIKKRLDKILAQSEGLPDPVKDALVAARNLTWQSFIAQEERSHQ